MFELTPAQREAVQRGEPVRVIDPATDDPYVIVRAEVYSHLTMPLPIPYEEPGPEIPPQYLRSAQAYWRDLPELLKKRRNRGKWVAYFGDERIGIAADQASMLRECDRRGLRINDYFVAVIEPHYRPPWACEEVDYGLAEYEDVPDSPIPGETHAADTESTPDSHAG